MESSRDTSGSTGQLSNAGSTGGGMHHSLSTPAGVDGAGGARTPPTTPKKGGKMLAIRVQMLDDTITIFQVQAKALGKVLFEQVCKQLHLLEADYFGLDYQDLAGTRYWLDLQKPVSRQLGLSLVDPLLFFCVKFYTPDPGQLEEEYTRYLYCLQVKRDLSHGLMHCNDNTAALMASYIVQAECGDYVSEDYPDHTYLSSYKFVPHQDQEMERKIMENHKKHSGQSPAEADLNLLETARRCELYGIKLHPAKDHENVPLNLAVAHCGIVVYQQITKINTFSWAKIRKLSFKRKKFLIKLHPEGYGYYKDTVEFFFEGRNECKNFWKKCVENHGFFRCSSVKNISRHKTRVLSRGSSFRYSGKTQKQIVEFVRDNYVKRQTFQRSASFRHSSAHSSANNMHTSSVGNSISAHPLLPLADSSLSVEVSKLSASLGAMGAVEASQSAHKAGAALGPTSPTTRSASRPRGTPTSWSSAPDTKPTTDTIITWSTSTNTTTNPARTMSTPSPPPMTPSPPTATSPRRSSTNNNSTEVPVAVHAAAVHRVADTTTPGTNSITTNIITRTICNRPPSQTQSQNDLIDINTSASIQPHNPQTHPRHVWQRSASCRELYDFSFEDSGQAKRHIILTNQAPLLESPITRYNDEHQSHNLDIHQDIIMPDEKIYSSSYPGTTQSLESLIIEDPTNYDLNNDFNNSQDDLSHDSYELLERSDDDSIYAENKTKSVENTRSCSLDSGNYIPSDSDSESAINRNAIKCKSQNDVPDIFAMDDPRDLPREIIPRKSDGNYYKTFKSNSRTSSLDSKSDYYESKNSKSSKESLKKHKKRHSVGSRTSSQESKSEYELKKPMRRKSNGNVTKKHYDSRTSSQESKSEYYDANSEPKTQQYDRKIQFERNYGIQKAPIFKEAIASINISNTIDTQTFKETSHVHSISLQNVETEQNLRTNRANLDQNTVPRTQKSSHQLKSQNSLDIEKITHIWPETIVGIPTQIRDMPSQIRDMPSQIRDMPSQIREVNSQIREVETQIKDWSAKQLQNTRSTESESNIFSFDEDKIQSLQDEDSIVPILEKKNYRDVFVEIEPRKLDLTKDLLHQPIERTKSDPNNLAWQRLNSNSRRLLLKHQKSIDLTPAESSDEDYLYKQIPSAPPIMKYRETQFEMPTAEFGHFDILKREIEGERTKFEVPKVQFESLGVKTQSDFINLPPKNESDIPYILHKRHIMNGTSKEEIVPEIVIETKSPIENKPFLFTQNIDLSKVDPITLEVEKSTKVHIPSPKRDITRIDPALLETLNSKLSQIESDSPTSSKTESLKPQQKVKILQQIEEARPKKDLPKLEPEKIKDPTRVKTDIKPKRIIKARMQPGKKGKNNKTKVRITSFSSDDESLDSDDVFGSTEATPTKLEFSPPQMRKEMESILKYESERKYLQYTMSSTEIEGSPPTTRKSDVIYNPGLDINYQTELRRISERSLSIPSSEDDFNLKTCDLLQPVFEPEIDDLTLTLETLEENPEDKSVDDTIEQITVQELLRSDDWRPDLQEMEEEKEKEKQQLKEDIESDILNLQVPAKTKMTEICSPSSRRKGQSSQLYAHARLNLSEGSAFSLLQKQQATESPLSTRRAKSLDTPVIPVNRLPPLDSFSSKDDTVEEEDHLSDRFKDSDKSDTDFAMDEKVEVLAPKPKVIAPKINGKVIKPKVAETKPKLTMKDKQKSIENDQIVPDVNAKLKKTTRPTLHTKPLQSKATSKVATKSTTKETKIISKPPISQKATPKTVTTKAMPPKSLSLDKSDKKNEDKTIVTQKSLPSQNSLQLPEMPEIKRTKSQELESCKRPSTKEKAKSLEKLEFKRSNSKERTKSQDESETDIVKRREYQQILYETAIKQTKTIKSPVKDILPVFPQVEEMVRERGGKLEISINTIENTSVNLEDAIIITKSPKKLDKKLIDQKLTKSLEIALTDDADIPESPIQRLGKSLDLDTRKSDDLEFDFKSEAINDMNCEELSIQDDLKETNLESFDTDTEETLQDQLILEGTEHYPPIIEISEKLKDTTILEKPPDLAKFETKSSSDSQSMERLSLGNSLEMKYIDDSGDSSNKSDTQHLLELQKASKTVEKLLMKKIFKRRTEGLKPPAEFAEEELQETTPIEEIEDIDQNIVRITSEEESLTEVSEIKQDLNFLGVNNNQKDAFLKLSAERSRSEDNTGSWMTVDCEEYVGTESFEYDNAPLISPEKEIAPKISTPTKTEPDLLCTTKHKIDLLKRSSDQSRSSDTTGSLDLSPGKTDESSVSCSIGIAIGLSNIERFASRDQLNKTSPDMEAPRSPRSPRICVLGRAFTIDEDSSLFIRDKSDSSSEGAADIHESLAAIQENDSDTSAKDIIKKPYPFEEKWSIDSELTQRLHKKITKKLSSSEKNSLDDSFSEKRKNGFDKSYEKPSLNSVDRLSAESRNSIDTESSSGSIGLAARGSGFMESSCTWKRFPLESGSASSSLEEIGVDQDMYGQEYFLSRENSADLAALQDVFKLDPDATPTKELFEDDDDLDKYNYPLGGFNLGLGASDLCVGGGFNTSFLSRTLSRISERSTNSEKSSVDEDSTKASTQSDSLNEESLGSFEQQVSLSSDPPSNGKATKKSNKNKKEMEKFNYDQVPNISNLLQRQISDDRRTSAEMADLSIDDIEIITSERGLKLRRQDSDDTIIDEEEEEVVEVNKDSSQESEEWPLPDIPRASLMQLLHETPSSDNSQPTTQFYQPPQTPTTPTNNASSFAMRGSLKSQDSEQWPSPPSSIHEALNVETHFITPPEEACKVIIDSNSVSAAYDNDSNSLSDENKTLDDSKTHTYENVATDQCSEISESLSVGPSGVKIVLENKSGGSSNSEELNVSNLNDDVFADALDHSGKNELRPPTVMRRRSTTSEDSSHSGRAVKKGSHSSYSEEDATSSMGTTTLEDGTVRFALKPTKCTHSSHSEDTSIALSLSEWSNSTTTVKFQNLSTSHSGKSNKSDDNSLTDIAHSFSEWSSSNSTLKTQNLQFQKLSSSTGDSTLTEKLPTISDWSSSDSKTLMSQKPTFCFPEARTSISRLGSSFDELDKDLKSPQNIPSEDLLFAAAIKSTERPILIPLQLSDEKSTESSSMEQRTVHTQRFDMKQKYQKSFKSSCERPVKVPLKLSKCSPYYSSSLSSESTPMVQMSKSGTIPLTRTHRKPVVKSLFQARSPPSENDSTSSMESPRCKSEPRDRRGYRRRRHTPQKRHRNSEVLLTKDDEEPVEVQAFTKDDYFFVDQEACQYNEYIRNRSMEELACGYHYDNIMTETSPYVENLEEGYYPDGDSQSGSDIFRMEREEDDKFETTAEAFDVSSIPPPLIEDDDFETDRSEQI